MQRTLTALLTLTILTVPSVGMAGQIDASTSIHEVNNRQTNKTMQANTGSVNQSAVYNVGQAATYRIDDIVCPSPALVASGSHNGRDLVVSAAVVVPLGGDKSKRCGDALKARSEHYVLVNEVNTANECANLIATGIVLDPQVFPNLSKYCSGVSQ